MPARFLIDTTPDNTGSHSELILDEDRSHYLCRVMRIRQTQQFACSDGRGTAFTAEMMVADSKRARVRITQIEPTVAAPRHVLGIGLSLLKGQAMDRAVQQATELGATHIWLFESSRSNAKLNQQRLQNKLRHWQKVVAGATEQCGRLHLPQCQISTLDELLTLPYTSVVLHPTDTQIPNTLTAADRLLLVGPEGGWSDAELDLFERAGCVLYGLGVSVLRAETVPAVALALFQRATGTG